MNIYKAYKHLLQMTWHKIQNSSKIGGNYVVRKSCSSWLWVIRPRVTGKNLSSQVLFGDKLFNVLSGRKLFHVVHTSSDARQEILIACHDSITPLLTCTDKVSEW